MVECDLVGGQRAVQGDETGQPDTRTVDHECVAQGNMVRGGGGGVFCDDSVGRHQGAGHTATADAFAGF